MPKVNDFGAGCLQNSPHDVDGGVMPVKQRCRGDKPNLVLRLVGDQFLGHGEVGHGYITSKVLCTHLRPEYLWRESASASLRRFLLRDTGRQMMHRILIW